MQMIYKKEMQGNKAKGYRIKRRKEKGRNTKQTDTGKVGHGRIIPLTLRSLSS